MTPDRTTIQYDMTLTATEASTGFFACIPHPAPELEDGLRWLAQRPMDTIAAASPQVTLRARLEPDAATHVAWAAVLAPNLGNHAGLPDPEQAPRPYPYPPEDIVDRGGVHITAVLKQSNASQAQPETRRPPGETAALALDADLDPSARIHPRLFANYLDLYTSQGNLNENR